MEKYKDFLSIHENIQARNIAIDVIRAIQANILRDKKLNREITQYLDEKFEKCIEELELKQEKVVKEKRELEKKYLGR